MRLVGALAGLAALWAAVIVAAPLAPPSARVATAAVYMAAGHVCHQRPERSFHVDGRQMPVCARCTGLYLAAPLGLAGVLFMRRRAAADDRTYRRWRIAMVAAAVPTAISLGMEWVGGPGMSSNISRALTALPLGAVLAAAVGAALSGHFGPERLLHYRL